MSREIRMLPETCRTLAFGSIVAGYAAVGTPLLHPIRIMLVQNLTDVSVMFSLDGINDHFPLSLNGHLIVDITANKTTTSGFFLSEGDSLYVKRIGVPTSGAVYFTAFYGKE